MSLPQPLNFSPLLASINERHGYRVVRASELALADAGLLGDPTIADGRMGIAYGSSSGSIEPVRVFGAMLDTGSMQGVTSTSYIQMMSHTAAVKN